MATYDMTLNATAGVGADSIPVAASEHSQHSARVIEKILDMSTLVADGYVQANNDVFELLEIPAGTLVLAAGAEVMTAFNGTTPTVDVDFAAGDDIVDGGDVTSAGYLASGTNGQANAVTTGAASTFTQFVSAADTIDVKLINAGVDVTEGVLRVYALISEMNVAGNTGVVPSEVTRDQRA
jgi:hypothetical protein